MERINNLNLRKRVKEGLATMGLILMVGATATACGKKPSKTPSEPTKIVNEITPTDEVQPTVTSTPVVEPTATVTVAPTATPTPTPIESKITTKTTQSKVEGYNEITSLSANDIKEGSMIQEYDKVLDVKDYAADMDLTNVTSDKLVTVLNENTNLDAETKKEFEDTVKAFETNKIDVPTAALYTNLPKLQIEEGNYNTNRAVVFDPFNCVIYVNTNVAKTEEEKKEAIKLGLGYAALETYTEVNGEKLLCSPSTYCYDANGNIVELGGFAKNAVAQIIASKLEGKEAVTPNDPNYVDVMKFTVALNYINPNDPYTYEKYVKDGYEKFADTICKYVNPKDLLEAEDFYGDLTPIDHVETTDPRFIATYNFASKLITPLLEYYHEQDYGNGDKNVEVYCMKNLIDTFFYQNQGYNFKDGNGYTVLDDKSVVVTEFTAESLKIALYTLTDQYAAEIIR